LQVSRGKANCKHREAPQAGLVRPLTASCPHACVGSVS
jgi:hypothetical protein